MAHQAMANLSGVKEIYTTFGQNVIFVGDTVSSWMTKLTQFCYFYFRRICHSRSCCVSHKNCNHTIHISLNGELKYLEEQITIYCILFINMVKKCNLEKKVKRHNLVKFPSPITMLFTDRLLPNLVGYATVCKLFSLG